MMLSRDDVVLNSSETKILWGIYETLQEIRDLMGRGATIPVPATAEQTEEKGRPVAAYTCKVCGQTYDNKGSLLACARKHKKEGV
jgi:hypothetical protein